MLVLIGGSASGKSTIEKVLCQQFGYKKITSYTTRSPREGEKDGIDYHFISEEEFLEKEKNGFFAETGKYNGWYYGSAAKDCTNDKVAVLTPHGMRQLKNKSGVNIYSAYIKVSRRDRLIKILERNDNIEEAKRRDSSDVGQFDGVEDEVDLIVENNGYTHSPMKLAEFINAKYLKKQSTYKNKTMTILCDVDDVVNNLVDKTLILYNQKYNDIVKSEDIKEWEINKFINPECKNIFKEFCSDELIMSLDLQPKAKEVINELMKKHCFYFVTSTHPDNVKAKHEWLKRNFEAYDYSNLIVCKNKKLVHGDILIDDCPHNFYFDRFKGEPVKYNFVFKKAWNELVKEDQEKTFCVNGWEDIYNLINKMEE